MATKPKIENIINHIVLVLDESLSMTYRRDKLIQVTDAQVKHLAETSQQMDQETRVTIYTFNDTPQCIVWDKDVLRLPSIASFYKPGGNTALIDATMKSIQDLTLTPQIYGDHAFFLIVLTDGEENVSRLHSNTDLLRTIEGLEDNWTVAVLVPDQNGVFRAKRWGFPASNIAVWDVTGSDGVVEVGRTIQKATDNYMHLRSTGVRSSTSVFSTSATVLNKAAVAQANLKPLDGWAYYVFPVAPNAPLVIRDFILFSGADFRAGKNYYQLMKRETIQRNKEILIRDKKTGLIYAGEDARTMLGLPDMEVRVTPDHNRDYEVFVQSNSNNRNLVVGTKLIVLK